MDITDDSYRGLWLKSDFSAARKLTWIGGLVEYLCPDMVRAVKRLCLLSAKNDGILRTAFSLINIDVAGGIIKVRKLDYADF